MEKPTIEEHVNIVKEFINSKAEAVIGGKCPYRYTVFDYQELEDSKGLEKLFEERVCFVCNEFVDINPVLDTCPCIYFGTKEAIKITKEKIKEFENGKRK